MTLKQVLKQTRGNCCPKICIGVCAPLPRELPNFIGVPLDMLGDLDDRLPTRIALSIGGFRPWKNALSFSDGANHGHAFSQLIVYDSS